MESNKETIDEIDKRVIKLIDDRGLIITYCDVDYGEVLTLEGRLPDDSRWTGVFGDWYWGFTLHFDRPISLEDFYFELYRFYENFDPEDEAYCRTHDIEDDTRLAQHLYSQNLEQCEWELKQIKALFEATEALYYKEEEQLRSTKS